MCNYLIIVVMQAMVSNFTCACGGGRGRWFVPYLMCFSHHTLVEGRKGRPLTGLSIRETFDSLYAEFV